MTPNVGAFRQPIDDLALALVAPLRADDRYIRHTQDSLSKHLNGAVAPEMRAAEAARFLLVIRTDVERVDGDPAFLAQAQGGIVRSAARQQDAARWLGRRQCRRQRVEIEREAGRVLARLVDIAAAAAELAGDAAPKQRERDAGVILEAAMIGRIDIDAERRRVPTANRRSCPCPRRPTASR